MKLATRSFWRSVKRGIGGAITHARMTEPQLAKKKLVHRAGFGTIYNLFLKTHSKRPKKQIYNILQAFKNYVMVLDPIIDSASFKPRQQKKFSRKELRAIPETREEARIFAAQIKKADLSREQKKKILRVVGRARINVVKTLEKTMENPFASKEEVFRGIEGTAGLFMGTVSDMASICYGLNERDMRLSRTAFENFTTALQIKDDMRDSCNDFGIVQNSIVSISKEHPKEFQRLKEKSKTLKDKKLSKKWIYANMPKTMKEAEMFFEHYMNNIPKNDKTKGITKACRDAFYGM